MVLLEKTHHILCEIAHVFADQESEMTGRNLFVMDYLFANGITSPSGVGEICERVVKPGENSHGYFCDILKRVQSSCSFLVSIEVVLVVVCENLEAVLLQVLGIMKNCFYGSSVWLMPHVYAKPVRIIESRIVGGKQ